MNIQTASVKSGLGYQQLRRWVTRGIIRATPGGGRGKPWSFSQEGLDEALFVQRVRRTWKGVTFEVIAVLLELLRRAYRGDASLLSAEVVGVRFSVSQVNETPSQMTFGDFLRGLTGQQIDEGVSQVIAGAFAAANSEDGPQALVDEAAGIRCFARDHPEEHQAMLGGLRSSWIASLRVILSGVRRIPENRWLIRLLHKTLESLKTEQHEAQSEKEDIA